MESVYRGLSRAIVVHLCSFESGGSGDCLALPHVGEDHPLRGPVSTPLTSSYFLSVDRFSACGCGIECASYKRLKALKGLRTVHRSLVTWVINAKAGGPVECR